MTLKSVKHLENLGCGCMVVTGLNVHPVMALGAAVVARNVVAYAYSNPSLHPQPIAPRCYIDSEVLLFAYSR